MKLAREEREDRPGRPDRGTRWSGFLFLFLCLASLAPTPPARAALPAIRQMLVVDADADPFTNGTRNGAVFILGYDSYLLRLATAGDGLVDPIAVAAAPDRKLYVVDAAADPLDLGGSFGVVWLADPAANVVAPVKLTGSSALFQHPTDVLVEPETGALLLCDRDADPARWGESNGCVFRLDPTTNSTSLVAAPAVFANPTCIAWDLDGAVLVVDQSANPLALANPAGALFRLNPRTGAVTLIRAFSRPQFAAPAAVAAIDHGPFEGDYLVADKDADPNLRGTQPGAVFRVPKDGGAAVLYCDAPSFREPIDILMGVREDILVMDKLAQVDNTPLGLGAVFRFRLDDGSLMQSPWGSNSFRAVSGFVQLVGAEVDSSTVTWTDENGGFIVPGDIMTVRARIRNTGTSDAELVTLSDTLKTPFDFILGSDSVSVGTSAYLPERKEFLWNTSLARGDTALVRFRIRLADDATSDWRYVNRVALRADGTPASFLRSVIPHRDFITGLTVFGDIGLSANQDAGTLYLVSPDSLQPATVWQGPPLTRPNDLVALEDGRIAVLDPASPEGDAGAILVYSTSSLDTVAVLRPLRTADGLRSPGGIALDRDGNLLLVDRNANPNSWPYTPPNLFDTGPGALYKVDVTTRELTLVAAPESWREPVDCTVDRQGKIVVLDYDGGGEKQGTLTEILEDGSVGREWELEARIFRDPVGIACDLANDLYICDPAYGGGFNPNGGAVLRVRRGASLSYSTASADSRLREPMDCSISAGGSVFIADRDANPSGYSGGDHGAVFELNPANGQLSVAAGGGYLRRPDGIITFAMGDLNGSRLSLATSSAGDPRPGDTLRVTARVINRGIASVRQALATLEFSSNLTILEEDPPPAGVSYATFNNQLSWTGRVPFADTAVFVVQARVLPGASYGTPAEVTMELEGGRFPVTVRQARPVRAPFVPNDILLVDSRANPAHLQDSLGAVFRLSEDAGEAARLVYSALSLQQPTAMEWTGTGDLVLAASRGASPGQVYRFNTSSGGLVLLTTPADTALKNPSDLLLSKAGDLFVVDPDAFGPTPASRGAVFRKATGLGPISVFASDPRFRSPREICYGPDGHLYLADPKADPGLQGGNSGAIFILDENTGEVLDWKTDPAIPEPIGIAPYDDSTLVVTDLYGSANRNSLLYFRIRSGVISPLLSAPEFRSIWRTTRLSSGELLIVDRAAVHPDAENAKPGLVWGYDPVNRRMRYYAWSDSFTTICDVVQRPGPVVRLDSYTIADLNGAPVHPADRLHVRALLYNKGTSAATGITYVDTLPLGANLIEESAFATFGTLRTTAGDLSWTGGLIPADTVEIVYDVQLNPALAEGRVLTFMAEAFAPSIGVLTRRVDVETHVPLEPGNAYVIDAEANPYAQSGHTGALFKVNLVTGATIPMLVAPEFEHPVSIALVGSSAAPKFLILDQFARNQLQRIGTLFLFDPATRQLRNLGGHASFTKPLRVLDWTENEALILDKDADPFGLTPSVRGPGAIYSIDLTSGEVTPIFSDTTLIEPTGLAWLRRGTLAISDQTVDPLLYLDENGAIFTLDLESKELEFFASSPLWRDPWAIAARVGGGLLVADRTATPYDAGGGFGSVHAVDADGHAQLMTVSKFFSALNGIESELNGNPLVADGNTDPYQFGGMPGAILRWRSSVNGRFLPLVSSRLFRDPEGLVLFGGVVPVAVNEASIETTDEGIALRWRGSDDAPGARFLVYRRPASGPDDPGDPDVSQSQLVSGGEEFIGPGPHRFLDVEVEAGAWYAYLVVGADEDGSVVYSSPLLAQAPALATRLALSPPAPNPFRPGRALRFAVPSPGGRTHLALYDVTGRRVRTLIDEAVLPGWHSVAWDGRDDRGYRVPSGIYFARIDWRREVKTARLALIQ